MHMADPALDVVIIITEEQEDGEEKRLLNPTPMSLELCFQAERAFILELSLSLPTPHYVPLYQPLLPGHIILHKHSVYSWH